MYWEPPKFVSLTLLPNPLHCAAGYNPMHQFFQVMLLSTCLGKVDRVGFFAVVLQVSPRKCFKKPEKLKRAKERKLGIPVHSLFFSPKQIKIQGLSLM